MEPPLNNDFSDLSDPWLSERCERMVKLAQERTAKVSSFITTQPQSINCHNHPEISLGINQEATARLSDADAGLFSAGYEPCALCEAELHLIHENDRLESQGVPSNLIHATLDNWKAEENQESKTIAKVRNFLKSHMGFLVLLGAYGTGKSHLAVASMRSFRSALYLKQNTLLRRLRQSYHDRNASDPIEEAQRAGLLVIDEMGLSGGGRDELPMLHEILDFRHGSKKPTILTGNISLEQLKEIVGDRLCDRLKESSFAVVTLSGSSQRREARERYFTSPDESSICVVNRNTLTL